MGISKSQETTIGSLTEEERASARPGPMAIREMIVIIVNVFLLLLVRFCCSRFCASLQVRAKSGLQQMTATRNRV
jgi:hypothetical protein